MKNKYLFKTAGLIFAIGLLFSALNVQAQNRNYLDFDGSNDYVRLADNSTLDLLNGATEYTFEAWVYYSNFNGYDDPDDGSGKTDEYMYIVQRYNHWSFALMDDGDASNGVRLSVIFYNKKLRNYSVNNAVPKDEWAHVAVIRSYDGSDYHIKFYVNGEDKTVANDYAGQILNSENGSADNLYIGQRTANHGVFDGYIDELRLKDEAVSVSSLHYNKTDNQYSSDANTAALFHFNEGSGNYNTVDEASSGNARLGGTSDGDSQEPAWTTWNANSHLPLAHEWTGGADSDWGAAGNWDGGVPGTSNDMIVPGSLTNYPVIGTSTEADCNNLLIESGATLEISSSSSGTGSLIIGGSLTNSGTITINRYMTSYTDASDGWRFLSSPVSSFTIAGSGFEPTSGNDDLYEYDETATTDNWLNYTGGSFGDTEFQVGKGYLVAYKTAATKQFTGDLNTGSNTVNLSYTSGAASPGWNLLGNPYTSAIDWDLLTKTTNVDGSVYVLRASDGAYISWNGSTGDLTDGIIPAMQGYFVKATATSQSVTMEAADQVHATGSYYKSSKEQNTLIVKVTGEKGSSSAYIQFRDDATKTFDHAIDAYKLFGFSSAPQVYTNDGENIYSINCLPDNLKDYWLPLAIKTDYPGEYTLNFSGLDNIGNNLKVKLKDLKLNATVNLSEGDNYSFVYSEGDDINRFELEFYSVTGINNTTVSDNSIVIYTSNSELIIRNTDNKSLTGKVSILNLLGQIVYSDNLNGSSSQTINTGLKQGVYIVHLTQNSGASVSRKIMIR